MVGRRDQRFMFSSKNMKIGERKRNQMSKIPLPKDSNSKEDKSCKNLNSHISHHMRATHCEEEIKEVKISQTPKHKSRPLKFETPMTSIFTVPKSKVASNSSLVAFSPHLQLFKQKRKIFKTLENESQAIVSKNLDKCMSLAIRTRQKLLSNQKQEENIQQPSAQSKYFQGFQTYCKNKCAVVKTIQQVMNYSIQPVDKSGLSTLQDHFYHYYYQWLLHKLLKDNCRR